MLDDGTRTGRPILAPTFTDSGNRGVNLALRRKRVFELRQQGMPFRAIAAELDISPSLAAQDMEAIYRQLLPVPEVEQLRAEQADTLDCLQAAAVERLAKIGWDASVVDRLLKIMERRARLLGLDAPTEVSGTVEHHHTLAAAEQVAALRDELADRRERRSA